MSKAFSIYKKALVAVSLSAFSLAVVPSFANAKVEKSSSSYKKFTGRVLGANVRLRTHADLESNIIKELSKHELLVVIDEKEDFYAVEPTNDIKAYIFRSFVLDNVIEGNRVNVRLSPDLEAPIINHLSTGKRIDGRICETNTKWLEIEPPTGTKFFVAKEFIEYAGDSGLKALTDRRIATANQLIESTQLLTQAEMHKPFEEVSRDRIIKCYQNVITEYKDFPEFVTKAKDLLVSFNEQYLHKKIAYLEKKASQVASSNITEETINLGDTDGRLANTAYLTDRMKIWEPLEESLYLSWAAMHRAKTMDDFYTDEMLKSVTISGILEAYSDPVKNKPGDFVVKERDIPIAYVYSTHVNLQSLLGKRVNLVASQRPNNSFAFPAYYVLDAE
ncbi:hypothetical protein COB11_06490 [Candidatus Aerophobetes bacterium]|uniref:SH3b domain-containing protein n=1 Tax=Aerophobetes bacterium TaxID=2030807 RepID=A0A2A4YEB9_UNCAE|nr:MAG: hypothetical protein COB11_06490 [Candidatus Aerophobetes bacterium]